MVTMFNNMISQLGKEDDVNNICPDPADRNLTLGINILDPDNLLSGGFYSLQIIGLLITLPIGAILMVRRKNWSDYPQKFMGLILLS